LTRSRRERRTVIPARAKGASPESIATEFSEHTLEPILKDLWLWIPGSALCAAPE
jgi:hypothetical protein